jgi:hypothetical protein
MTTTEKTALIKTVLSMPAPQELVMGHGTLAIRSVTLQGLMDRLLDYFAAPDTDREDYQALRQALIGRMSANCERAHTLHLQGRLATFEIQ